MARTHVTLAVRVTVHAGETVYRLVSPTGTTLVVTARALTGTLYDPDSLGGRGGRLTLPLATVKALAVLGTTEAPSAPQAKETTP